MFRSIVLTGIIVFALASWAVAQDQYYGPWIKEQDGRSKCAYYYKPSTNAVAYRKQYVYFDKKDPHWVYWGNPKDNPDNASGKDSYWARCPTKAHPTLGKLIEEGKDVWSILPKEKRISKFEDLKKADFPEAKVMSPPVPGSTDKRTIPCPTDPPDLPK